MRLCACLLGLCLFAFGCVRARHLNKPILSRKHCQKISCLLCAALLMCACVCEWGACIAVNVECVCLCRPKCSIHYDCCLLLLLVDVSLS